MRREREGGKRVEGGGRRAESRDLLVSELLPGRGARDEQVVQRVLLVVAQTFPFVALAPAADESPPLLAELGLGLRLLG